MTYTKETKTQSGNQRPDRCPKEALGTLKHEDWCLALQVGEECNCGACRGMQPPRNLYREIAELNRDVRALRLGNSSFLETISNFEHRMLTAEAANEEAERLINLGVEIMTSKQLAKWEGVRAWIERNKN